MFLLWFCSSRFFSSIFPRRVLGLGFSCDFFSFRCSRVRALQFFFLFTVVLMLLLVSLWLCISGLDITISHILVIRCWWWLRWVVHGNKRKKCWSWGVWSRRDRWLLNSQGWRVWWRDYALRSRRIYLPWRRWWQRPSDRNKNYQFENGGGDCCCFNLSLGLIMNGVWPTNHGISIIICLRSKLLLVLNNRLLLQFRRCRNGLGHWMWWCHIKLRKFSSLLPRGWDYWLHMISHICQTQRSSWGSISISTSLSRWRRALLCDLKLSF